MLRKFLAFFMSVSFILMPLRSYAVVIPAGSLPTDKSDAIGGTIVGGTGSFSQSGDTLNVNPTSSRFISEHNDFSIGSGYSVQYNQASSSDIAIARVVAANPSNIFGHLGAVGKVFLINPNGILFQPGSSVDTAGLIASTLPMTTKDSDFMSGATSLVFAGSGTAGVSNAGYINTPGGYVGFFGPTVENTDKGVINAQLGTIQLASGNALTVGLDAANYISVTVNTATGAAADGKNDAILNAGTLVAEGGRVMLNARVIDGLFKNAINNTGIIEANYFSGTGGSVNLVSAGGDISITGGTVNASDNIQVQSSDNVNIDGSTLTVSGPDKTYLNVIGDNTITVKNKSTLTSDTGSDYAEIWLDGGAIDISDSDLISEAAGDGSSYLNFEIYDYGKADETGVWVTDSHITSKVAGSGHAEFTMDSDEDKQSYSGTGGLIGTLESLTDMGDPLKGGVSIVNSTVDVSTSTSVAGEDTSYIGIHSLSDIDVSGSALTAADALGDAYIGLLSDAGTVRVDSASTLSASSASSIALVGLLGGNSVYNYGTLLADGGTGYGVVGLLALGGPCYAGGSITARGTSDAVPYIDDLINSLAGTSLGRIDIYPLAGFTLGSAVIAGSAYDDVTLGDINADLILGGTLGGSVYDVGDLNGKFAYLLAAGDIGTQLDPIRTNLDYIAGYSFGKGSIFVKEADELQVGFVLPFTQTDSVTPPNVNHFDFGMSLAAANGTVNVISNGDMTVNSIVAPRGGVYLQSVNGSIYAGQGWFADSTLDPLDIGLAGLIGPFSMDVSDTMWNDFGIGTYYPVSVFSTKLLSAYGGTGPNVIAGGYSYFSSLNGTIGVGTPALKDTGMSGGIMGWVRPGTAIETPVDPSVDFDPIYGLPPHRVSYMDLDLSAYPPDFTTDPVQVWPITGSVPGTFNNPLFVDVELVGKAGDVSNAAVRDGFTPLSALTLQFGAPVPPPPGPGPVTGASFAAGLNPTLRAYYEILSQFRYVSFEPVIPTTYVGYHPITPADMAAFDGITLDAGFYSFIDNNINLRNSLNSYFGQEGTGAKK